MVRPWSVTDHVCTNRNKATPNLLHHQHCAMTLGLQYPLRPSTDFSWVPSGLTSLNILIFRVQCWQCDSRKYNIRNLLIFTWVRSSKRCLLLPLPLLIFRMPTYEPSCKRSREAVYETILTKQSLALRNQLKIWNTGRLSLGISRETPTKTRRRASRHLFGGRQKIPNQGK
jgi:hypothetical protein